MAQRKKQFQFPEEHLELFLAWAQEHRMMAQELLNQRRFRKPKTRLDQNMKQRYMDRVDLYNEVISVLTEVIVSILEGPSVTTEPAGRDSVGKKTGKRSRSNEASDSSHQGV